MIKTEQEIAYIRASSHITDECLHIYSQTYYTRSDGSGNCPKDLITFIKSKDAELAFSSIAAFGKNTSIVHHLHPSARVRCRKQEIILLDFGAKVNGYCSDMTRMVFVGKPKKEWVHAYEDITSCPANNY